MHIEGNSKIRIEIKDWLYNAGIVGLYRILRNIDVSVAKIENYIEFDCSALVDFEKSFFYYFFETYEKNSMWYKFTEYYRNNFLENIKNETDEVIKKKVEDFSKSFSKEMDAASYKTAYEIITGDKNFIKNKIQIIKDKESELQKKIGIINEIYNFFIENKDIIQAKYVSYSIINNYWEGKSFLNKQQVNKNMFDLFKKDFVAPVLNFLQEQTKKKHSIRCRICNSEIINKSEAFEGLSWIKMDLDSARKTSVYWNHNTDIIICPLCHLVYACIPAGFVTSRKRGIFINYNANIDQLIQVNNVAKDRLNDIENPNELENVSYVKLINMIRQLKEKSLHREIDNIQVVKYDYKTGYSFNILSKQLLEVIHKSEKELEHLSEMYDFRIDNKNYINLYAEVVRSLYQNINLYHLLNSVLKVLLSRKQSNNWLATIIFKINMNFIGGLMSDKKIYAMKKIGLELKNGYKRKEEKNKIPGIAYRLLNNLKTKNVNGFLDVIINCFMHLNKEVPTLFVETINEVERFQAYGYAFLIGFTGEEYSPKDGSQNPNNI